jgi:hypothetical protein
MNTDPRMNGKQQLHGENTRVQTTIAVEKPNEWERGSDSTRTTRHVKPIHTHVRNK